MTTIRTALVTGGNRGLGRAVAGWLHAAGHRVVIGARDLDAARRAAAELGDRASAARIDITSDDDVARARADIGPVDMLVNNAGVLLDARHDPTTVPLDLVLQTLETNVLGTWRVSQAFVPAMVERGWGRVVMVTSGTGVFSNGIFAGTPAYSVSKAALNALTVVLAGETTGKGVLVNAVNPGMVRTRMVPHAETSADEAARDIGWACTLPDDGPTGTLLRKGQAIAW